MTTTDAETQVTESAPRPVSKLLKLDTFQGMTDEEIMSLIEHYKTESEQKGRYESDMAKVDARMSETREMHQTAYDNLMRSVEYANSVCERFKAV